MSAPTPDTLLGEILAWGKAAAENENQGASKEPLLDVHHVVLGALRSGEGRKLLGELLGLEGSVDRSVVETAAEKVSALERPVEGRNFVISPELKKITNAVRKEHGELKAMPLLRDSLQRLRDSGALGALFVLPDSRRAGSANVERLRTALTAVDALRADLYSNVVGQDRAVESVCDACFAGLQPREEGAVAGPPRGPRTILTFVGPPGVGKTLLAERVALNLKGGREKAGFLRLDMSEYAAAQNYEQLSGFAKAFNGGARGTLTSFVEANPDGVVLVDELEKAHRLNQNVFLQVLDAGRLLDALSQR